MWGWEKTAKWKVCVGTSFPSALRFESLITKVMIRYRTLGFYERSLYKGFGKAELLLGPVSTKLGGRPVLVRVQSEK